MYKIKKTGYVIGDTACRPAYSHGYSGHFAALKHAAAHYRRAAFFPSVDAKYVPKIIIASAAQKAGPGRSRKIARESAAPINGATA